MICTALKSTEIRVSLKGDVAVFPFRNAPVSR